MSFNNTSKILPYFAPDTSTHGVILPHSSRVLSANDINTKIEKTISHIGHLHNAQSHRNSDGGKGLRQRRASLQEHTETFSQRLALLTSAKKIATTLNSKATLLMPSNAKIRLLQLDQQIESMTHSPNVKKAIDNLFETDTIFAIIGNRAVSVENIIKTVSVLKDLEEAMANSTDYKVMLAASNSFRLCLTNTLMTL